MSATTEYLSRLVGLASHNPLTILSLFFLGLFRIAPIVAFAPFLGSRLPGGVKIGLSMALTLILMPKLVLTSQAPIEFDMRFIGFALKEALIGLIIATLCSIPFYVAETTGIFIDHLRGSSSIMATDPLMQTQVSPLGILYNYILIVLFFQINGPFIFLDAVFQSYHITPVDKVINPAFFTLGQPFWEIASGIINKIMLVSLQLAAPALIAILMAEVFLGIANRLAQQVQVAFLGMPLKSLLGLGVFYASWFYVLQQLASQSLAWIKLLNKMIFNIGI